MTLEIRNLCILALSIFCIAGTSLPASAHAGLEASMPVEGESLEKSPKKIVLTFTEDIKVISTAVLNAEGQKVGKTGRAIADGTVLSIPLHEPLIDGTYKVDYQVVGLTDSHPIAGSIAFSIQSRR